MLAACVVLASTRLLVAQVVHVSRDEPGRVSCSRPSLASPSTANYKHAEQFVCSQMRQTDSQTAF